MKKWRPPHIRYFDHKTFDYFTDKVSWVNSNFKFRIVDVRLTSYNDTLAQKIRNIIPFRNLLKHFLIGMYDKIEFKLQKV